MTQTSKAFIETDLTILTVPELRKLAAEHNVTGRSKMAKPALLAALGEVQRSARAERERMVEKVEDSFTIPGTGVTLTGTSADVMRHHYAGLARYRKDGRKNLTPAQRRRLHKKTNSYARSAGFISPKGK